MLNESDTVYKTLENYFMWNKDLLEKNYGFEVYIEKESQVVIEERKYIDISHVNYWINEEDFPIYKVHMRNGESLNVDSKKFKTEYCPHGVNIINEVHKREYL